VAIISADKSLKWKKDLPKNKGSSSIFGNENCVLGNDFHAIISSDV